MCSGAGAAALACLDMLVAVGVRRENIWVSDIAGVVYEGRTELMDDNKARYAQKTDLRTVDPVARWCGRVPRAVGSKVLKPEWLAKMAKSPLIMALANPEPEIMPDLARRATRRDHRHRSQRLSKPGQQRALLPVHLPRCA